MSRVAVLLGPVDWSVFAAGMLQIPLAYSGAPSRLVVFDMASVNCRNDFAKVAKVAKVPMSLFTLVWLTQKA
jgi:hypothetical protein